MFLEGALDAHLLHRLGREERADLRHDRTVHAADDDRVTLSETQCSFLLSTTHFCGIIFNVRNHVALQLTMHSATQIS